ncbi:MAG: formylmethanofuran dehydrogenase subunit E family protein [Candidatus Acetothermia bacterium]|jgi:formylmethanofuran dehydrogenase subunit E|nr:formylmethanofuran dehydrogenase subunit E family protein [Candidatus Acetothermia bacterium]MDH7504548.1 formylmethanofuran dehydrogenase subunit E family protein [Candidatus Acetothermia bacterium]
MEMRAIDPRAISLEELVERGAEFHGHLGPFLVCGLRMGLLALRELGSSGHSDLRATVETGTIPPLSCLIDGIQVATGCTLGKGNIQATAHGRPRAVFIKARGLKCHLKVELQPELAERFRSGDAEALAREVMGMTEEALFRWELR